MTLAQALEGIAARRLYEVSGYKFTSLKQGGHQDMTFTELPPKLKRGVLELTFAIYRVQKMVFAYDLNYVSYCMKRCGIKLKAFFDACDINKMFYQNLYVGVDHDKRLLRIRLELMRLINRLFSYVFA